MRVLYLLTDGFGGQGGIAQFNRDLLKAICSYPGVSGVVAFPRYAGDYVGSLPAKLEYVGSTPGKLRYGLRVLTWLLRHKSVDLIICTHLNLQLLAALARWITGSPVLLVLHGVEAWAPPKGPIRRIAVRYADWVAAVSRLTLSRFHEWASIPERPGVVLPCCVDLDRFTPGPPSPVVLEKYGLSGGAVILSLGRLARAERYKGFDELLEALGELRTLEPNLLYVVAGSGDDRERLQAKTRELGLQEAVRFTGYVPDAELVDLYRAARAFVLAGRGEGFGIVLLEAMACGVPVVASTLDGSFEAVGGGKFGIAVDPTNRPALIAALREALRRPVGERPAGIEYFCYGAFETRAHELMSSIVARSDAREDTLVRA